MLEALKSNPALLLSLAAVIGLLVGSFLNVVILRLPVMLKRQWQAECQSLMAMDQPQAVAPPQAATTEDAPFNLMVPPSRCPACDHHIRWLENVPVLSYLWLRGRCSACGTRIALRYPLVELLTAVLSVLVAWRFGANLQTIAALALTFALIALSGIDLDTQLLPDSITLPLIWLGLLANLAGLLTDLTSSVLGAVAGYASLWMVFHLFRLLTGKEGMGYGDFKLFALLGAWLGWQLLPLVILLASAVGAVVGITLVIVRGRDRNVPLPFGPFLAAAGWIALLGGHDITAYYLALNT